MRVDDSPHKTSERWRKSVVKTVPCKGRMFVAGKRTERSENEFQTTIRQRGKGWSHRYYLRRRAPTFERASVASCTYSLVGASTTRCWCVV